MPKSKITYLDEIDVKNKRVLLRADFDVSLNPNYSIADDARIRNNLPTINYLLKKKNKLICVAKLDRPKGRDPKLSLKVVIARLHQYIPGYKIKLVKDFLTEDEKTFANQDAKEILVLENIRFYPEEKQNNPVFAKKLSRLADVYVNDAFAMCHRSEASVTGVSKYLPAYGGLLLKKEIETIARAIKKPKKPFVAIVGGAKIETKINLISKLTEIADYVLVGGGLANTFLCAHGYEIGKSYCEYEKVAKARRLLFLAAQTKTAIILPLDVVIGDPDNSENGGKVVKVSQIPKGAVALDIGPETKAKFGSIIAKAKTIIWNGPIGYFENTAFRRGTDFTYYAIAENRDAVSIVGGGDTLSAISKEEYLDKITHISTGGGAMLEFIEKGTLPGIEALKK
ncbi:phosphoglycerate kinase [Candidatus Roizmanbacteria bacterium RIFCSPHIGHO2_01_FULL_39_12c]|uniref:Phosphoglycerate kinase n=1 Tax=Candidatus Roizmanbacteria bacterium RIFCSPHIGHO2_01_FULL_39_12c TaxID=1802031 RepID=A0A1F7GCM8_9BACT|nr:MAG: phosphoglycerate kinase [Candidatus Roizmanbacteria bacterium RIFCSPHIGHO2_01_FULL_39_12c]